MRRTKTNIALIDYENIGSLEGVSLQDFDKVLFFTGAKQESIKIPVTDMSSEVSVRVIPATEIARNNVDFHLVLELGQLVTSSGDTSHFAIVSRDKGYDGIITRLNKSGICCTRIEPALPISRQVRADTACLRTPKSKEQDMSYWIGKLKLHSASSPNALPSSPKALHNYLSNLTGEKSSSLLNEQIKQELIRLGYISVYEKTIVWKRQLHHPTSRNKRAVLRQVQ